MKAIKTLTAAAALATAATAHAGSAPFSMVGGVAAPDVDVSLTVKTSNTDGYAYDFIFSNNSLQGVVTGIYFETAWNSKASQMGLSDGPATLNPGSHSPAIAGWDGSKESHVVGQDVERIYLSRRNYYRYFDRLADGIQAGQSHTISFNTDTDIVSLQDMQDAVGGEGLGIAIRVQDVANDREAKAWGLAGEIEQDELAIQSDFSNQDTEGDDERTVTGVPTPSAALAGLAMMGVLGMRRRRR